ncbi:hypothetical protein [Bacillus cereus]|uniref:hypothetical protein n=1 Tax=Bacillus cereus TaxID=1396 RepID=UPI001ABF78AE|nr:hypothetical protein [Bacillus cereus]
MKKTVTYVIQFLTVLFVTGAVLFSTAATQNIQAASEPSLQTKHQKMKWEH